MSLNKNDLKGLKSLIDDSLEPVKSDLEELKGSTKANTASLMNLEREIGIYNDALDVERKRVDRHEDRISHLENS